MENLKDLKEELKNWETDDSDETGNLLHRYFEATQLRDWCSLADEARVVYKLMFNDELEEGSPVDAIISGVAAQAAESVWRTVAEALGLDKDVLQSTLEPWHITDLYETEPTLTREGFFAAYKEQEDFYKEQGLLGKN
jgi:hypothetical protein